MTSGLSASFSRRRDIAGWLLAATLICCGTASAQAPQMYQPLHPGMPPGQAAAWLSTIRHYNPYWMQPIRIELPTAGTISVYSASNVPSAQLTAPAQLSVNAGHFYRLQLADMPEFPGEVLFPSVELLDHLHPPQGQEHDFPIPIVITADDIRQALAGRMVTRIIYLEQPQLAAPQDRLRSEVPQSVAPAENALLEADRLGRPMAIIRLGGRLPSQYGMPLSYYGTGGAVQLSPQPTPRTGVARVSPVSAGTTVAGR